MFVAAAAAVAVVNVVVVVVVAAVVDVWASRFAVVSDRSLGCPFSSNTQGELAFYVV